ncbi:25S rRNA (adenine(645)-N(1))-methyltransferase-like [Pecten maximus]|uniref:25S rRNA (adenine(645)-N(1))-methyltransferase-like n=1 Tax=Pecten maximus TaxID=6579 RepID=UPI0014588A44|nr:25S rRNA (adenine(645)-N(1))-methyltransferase-like [Pecten maximus]
MDFSTEDWAVTKAANDLSSSLFVVGAPKSRKQTHQKKAGKEFDNGKGKVSKSVGSRQMSKGKKSVSETEGKVNLKKSKGNVEHDKEGGRQGRQDRQGRQGRQGRQDEEGGRQDKTVGISEDKMTDNSIIQCRDIKGSKRKAQTDHTPNKKPKHIQHISPTDSVNDESEGKKKKRRRKKKKNSNKRNKYKHLSVKKSEESVDDEVLNVKSEDDRFVDETAIVQELTNSSGDPPHSNSYMSSRSENTEKREKKYDGRLNKNKKSEKILRDENSCGHPGVKCKQGQEQTKFNVKVLNKILSSSPVASLNTPVQGESPKEGGTTLKQRMMDKLKSARFRFLNEQLYNQTGSESYSMFREDGEAFEVYHQGFQSQVAKWPVNPVNTIIGQLQARPRNLVIADFGCGDAIIARTLPNKVYSFDLVAVNKYVTACDMAKVPLKKESVDVAVFCLSLMGKNLPDYLREASRVLKPGGSLKVAEVTSRIRSLPNFKKTMERFGFRLLNEDTTNKMFCLFDFKKCKPPKNTPDEFHLEPCLYKRR